MTQERGKDLTTSGQRLRELTELYAVGEKDVVNFLKSSHFKRIVSEAKRRVAEVVEQGFVITYSLDAKFHVVWDKEVGGTYTKSDWKKVKENCWLPLGWIQFHPIINLQGIFYEWIPSDTDILGSGASASWECEEEARPIGMFGSVIIPGAKPLAWAWEATSLDEKQVSRLYQDWSNTLSGGGYKFREDSLKAPSYQDIENLLSDLRSFGLNIQKKILDEKDIGGSFASLIQSLNIQFGFKT